MRRFAVARPVHAVITRAHSEHLENLFRVRHLCYGVRMQNNFGNKKASCKSKGRFISCIVTLFTIALESSANKPLLMAIPTTNGG